MSKTKLRWGILSTAQIARKNWKAIRNSGNSTVTAVASRDTKRAGQFISECQADTPMETPPKALGSYEELLKSAEVDAVYIPLPTGLRKEWVIRAAEAGKHVLCEKPCASTLADLKEMIEACQRCKVQFMDGVMFMHSRRLDRIREVLQEGQGIGKIRRIASAFSFCAPDEFQKSNIRSHGMLEPHGCVGDLGWYCLRFALWVMNFQLPNKVTGRTLSQFQRPEGPAPVPSEFSGELFFDGGVSASFYCSFQTGHQQWATVSGTEGYLTVPDFVLPLFGNEAAFEVQRADYTFNGCDFNMESHARRITVPEYSNSHPNAQETHLFRNFSEEALAGKLNALWPDMAFKTQLVMEACLKSAAQESQAVNLPAGPA